MIHCLWIKAGLKKEQLEKTRSCKDLSSKVRNEIEKNGVGIIGSKFKSTFEVEKFSLKLERTIEVGNQFLYLKGHVHLNSPISEKTSQPRSVLSNFDGNSQILDFPT